MRVYKHLDENDLLPKEQKGCRRGSYGCKDQLLINKAIIEDAKKRKNLSTVWIDYKHRHAKRARVIFLVIGVFVELFTVMICLSFFWVAMYSKKETGNL